MTNSNTDFQNQLLEIKRQELRLKAAKAAVEAAQAQNKQDSDDYNKSQDRELDRHKSDRANEIKQYAEETKRLAVEAKLGKKTQKKVQSEEVKQAHRSFGKNIVAPLTVMFLVWCSFVALTDSKPSSPGASTNERIEKLQAK